MKTFYLIILMVIARICSSQDLLVARVDPERAGTVNLKWYLQPLVGPGGYVIYRQQKGEDKWARLNAVPIKFGDYKAGKNELVQDKELSKYLTMAASPGNIKDLVLLATVLKSFTSEPFAKHLGIVFNDSTVIQGKTYVYRLMRTNDGRDAEVSSTTIFIEKYSPSFPPREIALQEKRNSVTFKWRPEPMRYFGVNIYRKTSDTGEFRKLTPQPILFSKAAGMKDSLQNNDISFEDRNLTSKIKYMYYLEALDFFGSPSLRSEFYEIKLKDRQAPAAPGGLMSSVQGKSVTISWENRDKGSDLAGFNIYRTNKNDTDFAKVNFSLISKEKTKSMDVCGGFSSYMYKIGAVDEDGNESVSNPLHVEVYDNEPPQRPLGLHIVSDTGALKLLWKKNTESDLDGYFIYRTVNGDFFDTYVKLTPHLLKDTVFVDSLEKRTKNRIFYKVVAVDKTLNRSPYSEPVSSRLPDVTAPSAPFLKSIMLEEYGHPRLEWFPNPESDLMYYEVFRKMVSDTVSEFEKINQKPIDPKLTRFTDRSAQVGVLYKYQICAVDSVFNKSIPSNVISFKIRIKEVLPEIDVFHVAYNKRKKSMDLSWKLKDGSAAKAFMVYKINDGSAGPLTGFVNDFFYRDANIDAGKEYGYELRVYSSSGDVVRSRKVLIKIPVDKNQKH